MSSGFRAFSSAVPYGLYDDMGSLGGSIKVLIFGFGVT